MGSLEADDERQIAVADDWQLQRLAHSGSTNTAFLNSDGKIPHSKDLLNRSVKNGDNSVRNSLTSHAGAGSN